jgi:hypothetical protein
VWRAGTSRDHGSPLFSARSSRLEIAVGIRYPLSMNEPIFHSPALGTDFGPTRQVGAIEEGDPIVPGILALAQRRMKNGVSLWWSCTHEVVTFTGALSLLMSLTLDAFRNNGLWPSSRRAREGDSRNLHPCEHGRGGEDGSTLRKLLWFRRSQVFDCGVYPSRA